MTDPIQVGDGLTPEEVEFFLDDEQSKLMREHLRRVEIQNKTDATGFSRPPLSKITGLPYDL